MSIVDSTIEKIKTGISPLVMALAVGVSPSYALDMTAGSLMREMPVAERTMFISGIIHGMAYARFRTDTLTAGARDQTGMECILAWFSTDSLSRLLEIEATFEAYADEYPPTVLAAMVRQECGE